MYIPPNSQAELQGMLGSLEQSKTESLCVAEEQTVTLREHLQSEVDSYKVRYSLNILQITLEVMTSHCLMDRTQINSCGSFTTTRSSLNSML